MNELSKLQCEIACIYRYLNSDYNIWSYERDYLHGKMEDLIHSVLLERVRMGFSDEKILTNLDNGDYSVKSNNEFIGYIEGI